ncbi:ATP-dependent DNA helicase RecG [Eubacteriales bacterium KG127]
MDNNEDVYKFPIETLKGIGKKKKDDLDKAGINTFLDLLYNIPQSYEDRRYPIDIASINKEGMYLIQGRVVNKRYKSYGRKAPLFFDVIDERGGLIKAVFFNGLYVNNMIKANEKYSFYGKVQNQGDYFQMIHPDFSQLDGKDDERGILPVYSNIGSITSRQIKSFVKQINQKAPLYEMKEWLSDEYRKSANICSIADAIEGIHFPRNKADILQGKYRLIFDELLTFQTGLLMIKGIKRDDKNGIYISGNQLWEYAEKLPFELTEGQKKALSDVASDLESNQSMNRLIQGDVGCGKTVIAECAMYASAREGYQSALMVPTEILAKQHYQTIGKNFSKLGIKCGLLISKQSKKLRDEILEQLKKGDLQVVIGTHAVLSDGVNFNNLGLVITDEQHRFGVNQRQLLTEKAFKPNVLVMTATPIPRTMAVVVYGDLDISVIRTMPKGRIKVITQVANNKSQRVHAYEKLRHELSKGRQGYVITPLVEESEAIDANSAHELYEELTKKFSEFSVRMLHGRMCSEEKNQVMEEFYRGEIDLLVSTVVIEVGINVPNASVMVIENSERFGLSQLHQLRGRVGRGKNQSFCTLINYSKSDAAVRRAEIMAEESDGFAIAEEDLKLRGPGDILGTRQHGIPNLKFAYLTRHVDIMQNALEISKKILGEDPYLIEEKNVHLREQVKKLFGESIKLVL